MIQPLLDVHTHSVVSGHAYSTLTEMITAAQAKGLKIFGLTEHAPSLPGACQPIYFRNLHVVPRQWGDMRVLLGAEVNILDTKGNMDFAEEDLARLDICIAGIHSLCWQGGTKDENTEGLIKVIRNPWINIISHPGDGTADLHLEQVVLAAKEAHTLLEINNSSLKPVRNKVAAIPNNLELLRLSKKYEVPVILGSDAHITFDIANYEHIYPLLQQTDFPDSLIVNDKPKLFQTYLK